MEKKTNTFKPLSLTLILGAVLGFLTPATVIFAQVRTGKTTEGVSSTTTGKDEKARGNNQARIKE
jgi:hypothetical protein